MALCLIPSAGNAQISVSNTGNPSYSHPIAVPPGLGGMQPNLSLSYAGGGVNGPVGHGWSLQGVSMITRCAATRYTDGAPGSVRFDGTDKLCLDGQRLIQTDANGAPLAAASQINDAQGLSSGVREFRTEKDTYARIRAYGIAANSDGQAGTAANGPMRFVVWTKAGQIYEYGAPANTTDPSLLGVALTETQDREPAVGPVIGTIRAQGKNTVMVWAVSRIRDTVGNYMDFRYERRTMNWGSGPTAGSASPGIEWNVTEILYGGHWPSAQLPNNRVVFRYSDRSDRSEAYQHGSKNVSIRLLSAIDTFVNAPQGIATPPDLPATTGTALRVGRTRLSYDSVSSVTKRSRLISIEDCAGALGNRCAPPARLNYSNGLPAAGVLSNLITIGGYEANANFGASFMNTEPLHALDGSVGLIPGDFDGDGRTDILRWHNDPQYNALFLSNGAGVGGGSGTFTRATNFNVTTTRFFSNDQCLTSLIADFNGDGLPDIFRHSNTVNPSNDVACPQAPTLLFINNGGGSFTQTNLTFSTGPVALERFVSRRINSTPIGGEPADPDSYGWTRGANFYVLDVDGDGILDIIDARLPAVALTYQPPSCPSGNCTRVFKGNGQGGFTSIATNLTGHSVYSRPRTSSTLRISDATPDLDGDGLQDLQLGRVPFAPAGTRIQYRSRGDGSFEAVSTPEANANEGSCDLNVDFNGDGRADCLLVTLGTAASSNRLFVSNGTALAPVANFNLMAAGDELGVTLGQPATRGTVTGDFNGDGRTDLLRWHDDPVFTRLYVSNGDGTFRIEPFDLNTVARQLQHSNGYNTFVTGDFLGDGSTQILRVRAQPTPGEATSNQLYVRRAPPIATDGLPPDTLMSVTSPLGITTRLTYQTLVAASPPRTMAAGPAMDSYAYVSDRRRGGGLAAALPLQDLAPAIHIVTAVETDTGVGQTRSRTEYAYRGLKAALDGRGILGYRESAQTIKVANGTVGGEESLTTWTTYHLEEPYAGVVSVSSTRRGHWSAPNATLLSQTVNAYCDGTSGVTPPVNPIAPGATSGPAPCMPVALSSFAAKPRITRPYLLQSVARGTDLNGTALPEVTTTNTYNEFGDATKIVVRTTGTVAGIAGVMSTKTTDNIFCAANASSCVVPGFSGPSPNRTSGNDWIIGRLSRATVTNQVPPLMASISARAGDMPGATATFGTAPSTTQSLSPATRAAILLLLND